MQGGIFSVNAPSSGGSGWSFDGNIVGTEKYIGTIDAFDLPFRTGGVEFARLTTTGAFGIGTTTPKSRFHVSDSTGGLLVGTTSAAAFTGTAAFGLGATFSVIGYTETGDVESTSSWLWTLSEIASAGQMRLWRSGGIYATVSAQSGGAIDRINLKLDSGADNFTINASTGLLRQVGTSLFGGATATGRIIDILQGTATMSIGSKVSLSSNCAIYFNQVAPSLSNYALAGSSTETDLSATSSVNINISNSNRLVITNFLAQFTPSIATSGANTTFGFTTAASTGQTASTETFAFRVNMSATITHATGAIATQRDFMLNARTHAFVGASTVTDAATLAISGSPIAGANATITNSYALWIQSGLSRFDGNLSLNDAINVVIGTTTGTKFGTATTQKIGFWDATPIIQPASANQAALTNSTGGTYNGTLVDVGVVFSQANINDNFTDVFTLLDAMRTAMVNSGLMKGAA